MRRFPRARDSRLTRPGFASFAVVACLLALAGCSSTAAPPKRPTAARSRAAVTPVVPAASADPAPQVVAPSEPVVSQAEIDDEVNARLHAGVQYGEWKSLAEGWRYLVPKRDFMGKDGGIDVMFHFHGAELARDEWRQSGLNAIIVSLTLPGVGNKPYKMELGDSSRFGTMLDEVVRAAGGTHPRRVALLGYSAGYGAVGQVLSNDWYYDRVDTVVLLDGLHADLLAGKPDESAIAVFEKFAHDAVAGTKTMVVTHSAVVPPSYASTTQMTDLLLASVGVKRIVEDKKVAFGMVEHSRGDAGNFHLRGYRGDLPKDHMDQLRLLTPALVNFVVPRWTRLAVEESHAPAPPPIDDNADSP